MQSLSLKDTELLSVIPQECPKPKVLICKVSSLIIPSEMSPTNVKSSREHFTLEDFKKCLDDSNKQIEKQKQDRKLDLDEFRRNLGLPP